MVGMEVLSTSMGVAGAMMRGRMKADDDNAWVQMLGHVGSVGWVTDMGGGLSGHGNTWRW